jgi:ATP-dependent Clp protease adapter protein ClpS
MRTSIHLLLDIPGAPAVLERPALERRRSPDDDTTSSHRVILYNDDYHSEDEVVLQIQKATGYELQRAIEIMLEAHITGRAICFRGDREDCQRVARVLREIKLQVEVDCD